MSALRWLGGRLLGWIVSLWAWTWRVELELGTAGAAQSSKRRVFAFWHGQQMALLAARRGRRLAVLVSWSKDGDLQAGVMGSLGFKVIRGSSSRGGAAGLRAMLRQMRAGTDVVFAVDGPHGPAGVAKAGAIRAACLGRALLVPVASAASPSRVIRTAWDRFEVPLPFARVSIVMGEPVDSPAAKRHAVVLARALEKTRRAAMERVLG